MSYQTSYEELLALAQRYFPQEPALYALGEILDAAASETRTSPASPLLRHDKCHAKQGYRQP